MTDKPDTSLTISDDDIPEILRVCGEEKDPNWQDVSPHNTSNYLRERYWIKQWGPTERWKNRRFITFSGSTELRHADLGRKLDDPGDAFFDLLLSTSRSLVYLRTWMEVTEEFLSDEQAKQVNCFIRESNSLRGKKEIDTEEFFRSFDFDPPNSRLQCEMADRVVSTVEKKARKGCDEGSYKSLVCDYGRGQLIVGLPLWFALLPSNPTTPSMVLTDFIPRLLLGLKEIENTVLRASWCPFDSVVVLWNPMPDSIDAWLKAADIDFYLDPANLNWKTPISHLKLYTYLKKHNLSPSQLKYHARWDKYSSLDAMLKSQRQWMRLPNNPRPLGPKSNLKITPHKNGISPFYKWIISLWLFVRINGWHGLLRRVFSRLSIRRFFSRLRQGHQARKLFRSSYSKRQKSP